MKSVIFPWVSYVNVKKNELDEAELRSPSFDRFPFLLYVHFYSFTAAGIWDEIKVNELPDWDWAWSDGTKAANWRSRKGYLCEWFFLAVIHPTFKDAPWKESLDDLELFYDQRRKSVRIIWNYCSLRNEMEQNETKRNEMKICSLRNENL